MMHNRDELRSRSAETEPQWIQLVNGSRGCWPTDPDGGGTWVGSRDDGLTLGLLNLNLSEKELEALSEMTPPTTRSRGLVIPALLELDSLDKIVEKVLSMDFLGMNPFRLVMVGAIQSEKNEQRIGIASIRFDGAQVRFEHELHELETPMCWASSGLGDVLVQCRLPLFDEMVKPNPTKDQQHAFHYHLWDDRPERSVMMSRADARTSSATTIAVELGKEPTILYDPIAIGDAVCDPVGAGMLR